MSSFKKEKPTWLQSLCISILNAGPIPRHVAVIMDGNRRYASKRKTQTIFGHKIGSDKLKQTLSWCLDFGIREVTVYAFSLENFKRTQEEVEGIMDLAREKINELLSEMEEFSEYNAEVRFLGDLSRLPSDIRSLMAKIVELTKHNTKVALNVCFAYTSREEITTAIKEMAIGVEKGLLKTSDVNETLLENCLYSNRSHPVDLLIRTSGEIRLSDFLLWQASYSVLLFLKTLWPEFSFWHLAVAVFEYQRQIKYIQAVKENNIIDRAQRESNNDYKSAIEEITSNNHFTKEEDHKSDNSVMEWCQSQEERVRLFLDYMREKRDYVNFQ